MAAKKSQKVSTQSAAELQELFMQALRHKLLKQVEEARELTPEKYHDELTALAMNIRKPTTTGTQVSMWTLRIQGEDVCNIYVRGKHHTWAYARDEARRHMLANNINVETPFTVELEK